MAFQSIKKLLPPSCSCLNKGLVGSLVESMQRDSICLPEGYLAFATKFAHELFPVGWDSTYVDHCYSTTPPLSACAEQPRSNGGSFSDVPMSQSDFLDAVLQGKLGSDRAEAVVGVVQSAGKPRPLASFSSDSLVLKPLHKALYDRLSKRRWLLRGDLTDEALARAGFAECGRPEFYVSGDYRSATDNLPIQVAEAVLRVAVQNASRVPSAIGDYALKMLRPFVWLSRAEYSLNPGKPEFRMMASQQMGSLLSFPLLCVQNYIAFRYACFKSRVKSRNIPILINGDDILFCSTEAFAKQWMDVVGRVGLEVEQSKTSISKEFGTLNSTLVRPSRGRTIVIQTLRFGMLRLAEYPHSLSRSFSSFVSAASRRGGQRFYAAREWFSWMRPLFKGGLSLVELGFTGSLAWRAALFEGVLHLQKARIEWGDPLRSILPEVPSLHNVVLSGDDVVQVPSLSEEEEIIFGRELASWKWNLKHSFKMEDCRVRFYLALHSARYRYLEHPFHGLRFFQQDSEVGGRLSFRPKSVIVPDGWLDFYRLRYGEERPVPLRTRFFFRYIDRLPTYEEVVPRGTAVPETAEDLKHLSQMTNEKRRECWSPAPWGVREPDLRW